MVFKIRSILSPAPTGFTVTGLVLWGFKNSESQPNCLVSLHTDDKKTGESVHGAKSHFGFWASNFFEGHKAKLRGNDGHGLPEVPSLHYSILHLCEICKPFLLRDSVRTRTNREYKL